jgi:hypothetical protein
MSAWCRTGLVFDHTGFPEEEEGKEHLPGGWHWNYWEKIAKYVA